LPVLLFSSSFFIFRQVLSLRAPSTDRRETLPHDRKLVRLDKFSPKIRGALPLPKKIGGQNMQNFGRFSTTSDVYREHLWTGQDIENRKDMLSRAIPSAFDVKGPVNFGPLPTENSM